MERLPREFQRSIGGHSQAVFKLLKRLVVFKQHRRRPRENEETPWPDLDSESLMFLGNLDCPSPPEPGKFERLHYKILDGEGREILLQPFDGNVPDPRDVKEG